MEKFRNALIRFMSGRYGGDQFNIFILILSFILLLIYVFFINTPIITIIIWFLLLYYIFRTYSRNIYQRTRENERFLTLFKPFKRQFNLIKNNHQDKEHKYYLCPNCKQMVRVPKGRGKITITCPKCKTRFDKKS